MWRGEPFAGLESPWVAGERDALLAEHLTARLDFHDVALRRGRHAELVDGLRAMAADHPWDERLAGQVMLALYRGGRQSEALSCYAALRVRLADELGVDPSAPLRELHQRILTADPALAVAVTGTPRQLPAVPHTFTGRVRELSELDRTSRVAGVSVLACTGGDLAARSRVHRTLARAHTMIRDYDTARVHYDEAAALFTAIGDLAQLQIGVGHVYVGQDSLGYVLAAAGRATEAVPCFEESVALARELRDRTSEAEALGHLGEANESLGDRARTAWAQALAVLEELDPSAAAGLRAKLEG